MKFIYIHGLDELEKFKASGARQKFAVVVEHCRIIPRRGFSFFSNDPEARPMVIMQSDSVLVGCRLREGEVPPPELATVKSFYC